MGIRTQTLLIIGMATMVLLGVSLAGAYRVVGRGYRELEEVHVTENLKRTVAALKVELADLDETVHDLADREMSCALVQGRHGAFDTSGIVNSTFAIHRLNFIVYLDLNGRVCFGDAFDLATGSRLGLPPSLRAAVEVRSPLTSHAAVADTVMGVLRAGTRYMLVASRPILAGGKKESICGTLITGREITTQLIGRLGGTAQLSLDLFDANDSSLPPPRPHTASGFTPDISRIAIKSLGHGRIAGYAWFDDVGGGSGCVLRAAMPREIYHRGRIATNTLMGILVIAILIYGLVVVSLLDRRVLRRLADMTHRVSNAATRRGGMERKAEEGRDELGELSHAVAGMIEPRATTAHATKHLAAMDAATEGIAIMNDEGLYLYANRAYVGLFGYDRPHEVIGGHWRDHFEEVEAARLDEGAFRPLAVVGRWRGEAVARHADGAEIDIELSLTGLPDGGIVCQGRDVREQRQARRERKSLELKLRQAQKLEAVGTLASGMAHEFNNILTSILGFTELTRKALPEDHEARRPLDKVEMASHQAAHVTGSLLAFTHKDPTSKARVDGCEVVRASAAMLEPILPGSIELILELPDRPAWIQADPRHLQQALVNLSVNARDAMPNGGRLTLRLRETAGDEVPDRAVLEIQDTGIGMTPEVVERLFEPFFTTKGLGSGTGLGLAVVHDIVKDHEGMIQVHSKPGQGTLVRVCLPSVMEREMVGTF